MVVTRKWILMLKEKNEKNGQDKDNTMDEEKQKLNRVEKMLRRLRFSLRVKMAITIFIIVGLLVYLYWVYAAASALSIENEKIKSISPTGSPGEYIAVLGLTLDNPTSTTIEVDRITYHAYIEDNFVGEGEETYFKIEPGVHELEFPVTFNIQDLPVNAKTLFLEETANLTIKGEFSIPAKVFGLFTYTTITAPYSITEQVSSGGSDNWGEPEPVILREAEHVTIESVRLTWTESTANDFAKYEVHTSTTEGFEPTNETRLYTIYDIHTTTYEITGLKPTREYYFKIVVWTTHNFYSVSNEVSYPIP
jgi:LEA14-like dessication related protein